MLIDPHIATISQAVQKNKEIDKGCVIIDSQPKHSSWCDNVSQICKLVDTILIIEGYTHTADFTTSWSYWTNIIAITGNDPDG